jgi:hypothetical protein
MAKQYTLEKANNGMFCILLDKATISKLTENGNKRAIGTLNNIHKFHCAIMLTKEGSAYVYISHKICKKMNLTIGNKVTATFTIDDTPYQFEMPAELAEVLRTDAKANKIFHSLTAGNQRSLLYLITLVKSIDKKIERALKIAEKLKQGVTSPKLILK